MPGTETNCNPGGFWETLNTECPVSHPHSYHNGKRCCSQPSTNNETTCAHSNNTLLVQYTELGAGVCQTAAAEDVHAVRKVAYTGEKAGCQADCTAWDQCEGFAYGDGGSSVPQDSWTQCASEGGTCHFIGKREVWERQHVQHPADPSPHPNACPDPHPDTNLNPNTILP